MLRKSSSLKNTLLYVLLFVGIIPIMGMLFYNYMSSKEFLINRTLTQLQSVCELTQSYIENYFSMTDAQIAFLSEEAMTLEAFKEFKTAYQSLPQKIDIEEKQVIEKYYQEEVYPSFPGEFFKKLESITPKKDHVLALQNLFISNKKNKNSLYLKTHRKYHSYFSNFVDSFILENLFLIDNESKNIIYSKEKNIEFGLNLYDSYLNNSAITKVFNNCKFHPNKTSHSDFDFYIPNRLSPAIFFAKPIYSTKGETIGTLILQGAVDYINKIMTENSNWKLHGLGDTGESYIVGADSLMRSDSRFLIENPDKFFKQLKIHNQDSTTIEYMSYFDTSILFQKNTSASVINGLNELHGQHIVKNYRGTETLSAYAPLNILDLQWVLLAEIDIEEALLPLQTVLLNYIYFATFFILIAIITGLYFSNRLLNPIHELSIIIRKIATKNYQLKLSHLENQYHEFDEIYQNINQMKDKLLSREEENKRQQEKLVKQKQEILNSFESLQETQEEMIVKNTELRTSYENLESSQQQLVESGKMASVGKMLSGISHEINTPLGAISASVENQMSLRQELINSIVFVQNKITNDNMPYFLLLLREIMENSTNIKSTREERKIKRALREQNIEFAYGLSDDQCNKLGEMGISNIESFLPILKTEYSHKMLKMISNMYKLYATMQTIKMASNKCDIVLKAIKDFSYTKKEIVEISLQKSVETIIILYQNITKYIDLEVTLQQIPNIIGIEDELSQVWTNLLQNAIHASAKELTGKEPKIRIYGKTDEKHVFIYFEDNGTGIPEKSQKKIFDAFYTTKDKGKGTGLGLDISKQIIEKHGGEISFETSKEGTIFSVMFLQKEFMGNTLIDSRTPVHYDV